MKYYQIEVIKTHVEIGYINVAIEDDEDITSFKGQCDVDLKDLNYDTDEMYFKVDWNKPKVSEPISRYKLDFVSDKAEDKIDSSFVMKR